MTGRESLIEARDAREAIDAIHALAACEVAFDSALNAGRGLKGHAARMDAARVRVFRLIVGREPTDEEKSNLLYGDA